MEFVYKITSFSKTLLQLYSKLIFSGKGIIKIFFQCSNHFFSFPNDIVSAFHGVEEAYVLWLLSQPEQWGFQDILLIRLHCCSAVVTCSARIMP